MAKTTGGFSTYNAIGNREDLTDIIYNISPSDTPFVSMIGRAKASATFHEWQTDTLAAANLSNAQFEGNDTTVATSTPTTRIGNYCQISEKSLAVTGTQEAVMKAGRDSEVSYQLAKRGKELRIDVESIAVQNQGQAAGSDSVARKARALESWMATNTNRGAGGANAAAATAAPTDGTQRDFTETLLRDVISKVYTSGGNPTTVMVGPNNKMNVSATFIGRKTARENVSKDMILGAASLYASDYGDLKVVPNRRQRDRSAFVLDPEYWAIAYLRGYGTKDLAVIGDSTRKLLNVEWTLEARNEASSGVVADLNTAVLPMTA